MKCEPKVMKHFSTVHTSFAIDFTFTNNITILTGLSAVGKTAAYSFIRECMAVNPKIVCLNYLDYQKNVKEILMQIKDKLIVILLDDETRKYISLDGNNQYLIIGRNPKNLFTTKDNLFELVSKTTDEVTEFRIQPYF